MTTHHPSPSEKTNRNRDLVAAREDGATYGQLALRFGISRPRAVQIVQMAEIRAHHAARKGSAA